MSSQFTEQREQPHFLQKPMKSYLASPPCVSLPVTNFFSLFDPDSTASLMKGVKNSTDLPSVSAGRRDVS